MKNKKTIMFGALALVLLSGLSAASTTFAWFTTTRTASLTFSEATVETKDSNLVVSYVGSPNVFGSVDNTPNDIKLSGVNRVTDISGDGLAFYKPVWSSIKDVASSINEVTSVENYYIDFLLKIERQASSPSATGFKVYLGVGTKIAPVDDDNPRDVDAVSAVRMAVISYADAARNTPALVELHSPVAEVEPKYIVPDAGASAYSVSGYKLHDASAEVNSDPFFTAISDADGPTHQIADLTSDSEAYVGFRFWIEGTDAEATKDKALGGMFKVALDIYAL
jgi:hypothetical protein